MSTPSSTQLDPITLEVLRNALPAIADEMSVDLQRTSYNMMIYEVRDYCCALLDIEGHLISQNIGGVSHFVADLGVIIKDGVARYGKDGFRPGDVLVMNHQRVSGQHLNNMCVYTPCFFRGTLVGFAIVRAHWADVGGMSTGFGSMAFVSDPWMEGLQFNQIKLYEQGVLDEKLMNFIRDNMRYPDSSMGDLRSQMAACKLAQRRLEELFERYGAETIVSAITQIFDETETKCRHVVETIPDGCYIAESFLDHDWADRTQTVPIKVRVVVAGSDMTIDLTESSLQTRGAINSRTLAGPYIAYKGITSPLEPLNEGSFRALNVKIQEGNLMMAKFPAPMAGWSRPIPTVVDTILKALSRGLPDKMPAAHMGTLGAAITFFGFDPAKNRDFVLQTIEGGGWGARPWEDGESASVSVCQGDVRNVPVETMELKAPVVIEMRALRADSGGAGKYRGGLAMTTQVRGLVEGRWSVSNSGRTQCAPWGLAGGKAARVSDIDIRTAGDTSFHRDDAARTLTPADTSLRVSSGGGGGWGEPFERDPQRVLEDVLEGYVSRESAREAYGVCLNDAGTVVDIEATQQLRSS